jgi:hypothetical protein
LDFFTTLVKKMLTWQRPWPRSPPRPREETDLDRLDEDQVRVVSETLQLEHVFLSPKGRVERLQRRALLHLCSPCSRPSHHLSSPKRLPPPL